MQFFDVITCSSSQVFFYFLFCKSFLLIICLPTRKSKDMINMYLLTSIYQQYFYPDKYAIPSNAYTFSQTVLHIPRKCSYLKKEEH